MRNIVISTEEKSHKVRHKVRRSPDVISPPSIVKVTYFGNGFIISIGFFPSIP